MSGGKADGARRVLFAVAFAAAAGCLSPERAGREADGDATALASAYWRAQTGCTNSFDMTRPADVLAMRVAMNAVRSGATNAVFPRIEGAAAPSRGSNGTVRLSLDAALRIGARGNRRYQTLKEDVYIAAVTLDSERYAFETTFSGMILGALSGEPEATRAAAEAGGDSKFAKKRFEQGATVAGNMAVDVARMIRDDWHSFGWTGDLTVNLPLLRGAGRDVVREPLTQAERDLACSLMTFDRYRQTFAVSVAKAYFRVLAFAQNHRNSGDNARRLEQNWARAEMMFKAGRMDRIQVDQARTDLLSARQSMITTRQSWQDALDDFKMTLGLPPDAPVELDDGELSALETAMGRLAERGAGAQDDYPPEDEAVNIALVERRDLAVARSNREDAERKVRVAADALRADLSVEGGVSYEGDRIKGRRGTDDSTETSARVKFSLPWDRRRERNAYGKALVARERARRALEQDEDAVKNEVRSGLRGLAAARALYRNKAEALKVAQMRVDSNDLFMQSGRSSMRDILEAEAALLSARNALCAAVIEWWTSDLDLKSAMGLLRVESAGVWK